MTLIVGWASLDNKSKSKELSSVYLLSDSRITWESGEKWDNARKVFNFQNHPDIIGYSGDVLFPTQVISQIITIGDAGLLFDRNSTFHDKSKTLFDTIKKLFENYPLSKLLPAFSVYHCGKQVKGDFGCSILNWDRTNGWSVSSAPLPLSTGIIFRGGSGASKFKANFEKHFKEYNDRYNSRDVFQIIIDTLFNIKDATYGGPPQLVGVYRGDYSQTFGLILNDKRFVIGLELDDNSKLGGVEWRNELFERCDPETKSILPNAKRQPKILP